jgi:zinc protease
LIATIPRQEIIDYYHTYYQPNNMILLVIGDFQTVAMQKTLDETFGRHPAQPIPSRPVITVPVVKGKTVRRIEADVAETRIDFHFRLPAFTDPSYVPLRLLAEILNSRAVSPLQKSLGESDNPLAAEDTALVETQDEFSALHLSIKTDSAGKSDAIIAAVEKVIRDLPSLNVPPEDLRAMVTRLKVQDLFLRERLHYYAMMKAPMLVVTGYEFMDQLPDRMGQVTLAEVRQMAAKYLSADNYVATIVTPKVPATTDTAAATKAAVYAKRTLSNGLVAIVKSNPDSRVFAVNVLGKYRAACEPEGATGISDFVNRMLVSGTEKRNADQIDRELTAIGAELTANDNPYIPYDDHYTTPQFTFIKFATIDEFAPRGVELLADMLDHSIFPPDEVAKTQKKAMGILGMASGSTGQTCRELYLAKMFADGPYAHPVMGSQATVMGFTSEALRNHLHTLYAPSNMILTCATNLSIDSAFALLENSLGKLSAGTPPVVTVPTPTAPKGVVSAHKQMQKEQVYIYLGGLVPGAPSPDAPAIMVANQILSARLGAELREKQGLAYSVGSSVRFDHDFGWLACAMGTGKKNFTAAKDGILHEIQRLRDEPPSAEEVSIAQNSIWGSTLTSQLSRVNQAFYMGVDEFIGVGYDRSAHLAELVRAVKPADIQRVAGQYLDPQNYVLATVGNLE